MATPGWYSFASEMAVLSQPIAGATSEPLAGLRPPAAVADVPEGCTGTGEAFPSFDGSTHTATSPPPAGISWSSRGQSSVLSLHSSHTAAAAAGSGRAVGRGATEGCDTQGFPTRRYFASEFVRAGGNSKQLRAEIMRLYLSGDIDRVLRRRPSSNQKRVLNIVTSQCWLAIVVCAIVGEMVVLVWREKGVCSSCTKTLDSAACHGCDMWNIFTSAVVLLFSLDTWMRCYGYTRQVYWMNWLNIMDTVFAVAGTFFVFVLAVGWFVFGWTGPVFSMFSSLLRLVRLIRMFRLCWQYGRALLSCMRQITGQNKTRFVDLEHDLNLDLAYITPRLIGMSVPAAGLVTRLYRNPLAEVVRFFEIFHSGHYLIANMCPELPYPLGHFRTGIVRSYDVQDHTPPLLDQFVEFLNTAAEWLSDHESHVMAVHCRGGKGRTGCFCCCLLLYLREVEDATDALNFFAMRRTDILRGGAAKSQGVETPSQQRYIDYIEEMLLDQSAYFPEPVRRVVKMPVRLRCLTAHQLFNHPMPTELMVIVQDSETRTVLSMSPVSVDAWDLGDTEVRGDVRVIVLSRSLVKPGTDLLSAYGGMHGSIGPLVCGAARPERSGSASAEASVKSKRKPRVAGKEPGCLFYFHLHTSFLSEGETILPVASLDQACKKRQRKLYNPEGFVVLSYNFGRLPTQDAPEQTPETAAANLHTMTRMMSTRSGFA